MNQTDQSSMNLPKKKSDANIIDYAIYAGNLKKKTAEN